jgi:hypothetical protein
MLIATTIIFLTPQCSLITAFYTAGIVFSVVILAVVALQSYITSIFILESYARAERLNEHSFSSGEGIRLRDQYDAAIRQSQMYELSGLQKTFLGTRWTQFFTAVTACDLYSISWTLAAIFGQALSAQIPIPGFDDSYQFWVGIFVLITVPLSCTRILDQALLQFVFLGCRLLMVVLMLGTLVAGFALSKNEHFGEQMGPADDTPLFNLKNTMTIVQVAIFSTAFQFSVPSLVGITNRKENCTPSDSSSNNDKKDDMMSAILRNAVVFVYVSNCVLAIMAAVYFGSSTNPSSNLNWSNYNGGGTKNEGWSKFVSGYITMFAAMDGLAIFPLLCSTLGGILVEAARKSPAVISVFDEEVENDRKRQIFFRLLAALPPSVAALFFQYLHVIAKYGCIFTMLAYSAAPAFLYLASGTKMEELQLSKATVYTSRYFSHNWVAYSLLVLTFLAMLGVIVDAVVF